LDALVLANLADRAGRALRLRGSKVRRVEEVIVAEGRAMTDLPKVRERPLGRREVSKGKSGAVQTPKQMN
jgi:hypothetical protein